MLGRHVRFSHVFAVFSAVILVLGGAGCAPKEEVATGPVADEIPVTTTSETARALYEEGEYLADVGRNVQAREKFMAAIAEDPAFVRAHFGQSTVAVSYKEFQTCLDTAEVNIENASEGERLMVEINRSFLTNDTDKGLQLAKQLVEAYPSSARAAIILGGMQSTTNDNVAARASYARALEIDPDAAGALVGIAFNYLFSEPRDFAKAEEYAQRMTAAYPNEAKGYELMGDINRAQNDLDAALEAYNQATDMDPTLAQAQLKKGHVNSFLGNFDDALAAYDAAITAATPENKAGFAPFRAFTYIHAGDIDTALDELEAVAENVEAMGTPADQVKGLQVFALTSEAAAALHAGRFDRAADCIVRRNALQMEIAEEVGTDDAHRLQKANCRLWDGLLAAHTGDLETAVEHADKIAALVESDDNPRKMEPYHNVMGMAYLKQGDHERAAEHLRQANYENDMYIRYHLALAEEGIGNVEEARAFFADVASYNFNSVNFALLREEARERSED
jgi:tetratricopeptide (TPR) repeat protein